MSLLISAAAAEAMLTSLAAVADEILGPGSPQSLALAAVAATAVVVILSSLAYCAFTSSKKKVALHPEEWRKFQLIEKTPLSHNVVKLRFALQTPTTVLGLPIGQHISIQGKDPEGKEFMRPYTPVSLDTDVGHVDFVIKLYPQGAMSQFLAKAEEGNFVAMRGPKGRFKYSQNMVRHFGMIGGGSGITPLFQVARAILEDSGDKTSISLISANVAEEDILLKKELDSFEQEHPGRISIRFVLNKPPEGWTGDVGFVTKEIIQKHLPAPADDIKILYCGPLPMNKAMAAALKELGYTADMMFQF